MANDPEILYYMVTIPRRFFGASELFCKDNNLDETRCFLLAEIYRMGSECGFDELMHASFYSSATISKQLKRLVEGGYVYTFMDNERGNHLKRVRLTELGNKTAYEAEELFGIEERIGLGRLTEEECESFRKYLELFYKNINPRHVLKKTEVKKEYAIILYLTYIWRYIEQMNLFYEESGRSTIYEKFIMMTLLCEKKPCTFKKLERITAASQTHLNRCIHNLEKNGAAYIIADSRDRRSRSVGMTDKGAEYAKEHYDIYMRGQRAGLKEFSDSDIEKLRLYLMIFERNIVMEYGDY